MASPLEGRIGVAIQGGRRTVSRLSHDGAFDAGWRVGDVIVAVNGVDVADNEAVKAAVKAALAAHAASGAPLHFVVKRKQRPPPDLTQSMLRMTPGGNKELTMSMRDLVLAMVQDFPVVLFMDGTMNSPKSNLSAWAVKALQGSGVAFKAVDCSDEFYNPGAHEALEAITKDYMLPQLFAGGQLIGNGYKVQELQQAGELPKVFLALGAPQAERPGNASTSANTAPISK